MIPKIITIFAILLAVGFVGQWLINRYSKDNEQLRKLVHVLHGVGLAALAFVAPFQVIAVIEIIFLFSVVIARYTVEHFDYIPWIAYCRKVYQVGRLSYGEFFFPISAILLAILADGKWEFAASILILGLADTAAALVGKKHGKESTYTILGQKKSLIGSLAFYCVALGVTTLFTQFAEPAVTVGVVTVLWVTLIITISENIGVYGTDNLLIPLTAVYLLNAL